jgi:hypothetical protein
LCQPLFFQFVAAFPRDFQQFFGRFAPSYRSPKNCQSCPENFLISASLAVAAGGQLPTRQASIDSKTGRHVASSLG